LGCQTLKDVESPRFDGANARFEGVGVEWRGRGPEETGLDVVGVDAVLPAELPDLGDGCRSRLREAESLFFAADFDQGVELGPPAEGESAVASAGAAAADVGLQEHDVDRRIEFLDPQSRPETGVAAADDAYVGAMRAGEGFDPLGVRFK